MKEELDYNFIDDNARIPFIMKFRVSRALSREQVT